jgi:OFA family oxalate/formate antiporter-like MFS transporter
MPASTPDAIRPENRLRHAVVALLMQFLVSLTYSYSVFRVPLASLHGWSKAQTIAPYQYMLLLVSIGSIIGGMWQDRKGARIVASCGGLLIALGCMLAALYGNDFNFLVLTFGVVVGLGVGLVYVTPIANLLKWFPDKRGMVVGFAVMGSGFSALFWGPLIEKLIGRDPAQFPATIPRTFLVMAINFSIAVTGLAQFYRVPPAGWRPQGWFPVAGAQVSRSHSTKEMLQTWQFYLLYLIFFLGTAVGQTAIGQAAPLLQEVGRAGAPISSGVALGVLGLFNAGGRLGWGSLSDYLGRKRILVAMSLVSILACLGFLREANEFWGAISGLCIAAFAYAGFLALMPAFTADYFGPANVGANYGVLFTAWGVCGFVVPGYFERLLDHARDTGGLAAGYREVYVELAVLAAAVGVLAFLLAPPTVQPVRNRVDPLSVPAEGAR